ncbi:helix-turn-helix domain-containing protein [Planctomycetota bacterium]
MLKYFLNNPGRIISRNELLTSPIWNDSICSPAEEGGRTFDVNMSKLRRVIEPDSKNPQIIKCVRGEGWILARDVLL